MQLLLLYTWGDNYVILLTTVTAAMLEVYLCIVVNLCVLANSCVWNYTPVEKKRSANNIGIRIFRYPYFSSGFVHTKYTSNMAACYGNDVAAPHVYLFSVNEHVYSPQRQKMINS